MSSSKPSNNYPPELRERAIRMVAEARVSTPDWAAAQSEAERSWALAPRLFHQPNARVPDDRYLTEWTALLATRIEALQ